MSRAFTKEDDTEFALADIGQRPVSQYRNLVTRAGLDAIDAEIRQLRAAYSEAERDGDRQKLAVVSRDMRYWSSRRETAELVTPERDASVVRFGMTATIEDEDGKTHKWTIVGEDEADAAKGKISHVSPMAMALFGKAVGEEATVNGREWVVTAIKVAE